MKLLGVWESASELAWAQGPVWDLELVWVPGRVLAGALAKQSVLGWVLAQAWVQVLGLGSVSELV